MPALPLLQPMTRTRKLFLRRRRTDLYCLILLSSYCRPQIREFFVGPLQQLHYPRNLLLLLFVSETWRRRVPLVFPMWSSVPSLPLLLSILQPVSWSSFCIFSLGGNSFNFVRLSNSRQKLKRQFNKFLNSLTKLSQNTLTQFFQGSNPPSLVCDSTVLWRLHHVCDIVE